MRARRGSGLFDLHLPCPWFNFMRKDLEYALSEVAASEYPKNARNEKHFMWPRLAVSG